MDFFAPINEPRDTKVEARKLRKVGAHDRCLYTFTCTAVSRDADRPVTDNRLRLKGGLSFLDSFTDPLAGTRYMICSAPPSKGKTADYFERVGKHMAVVMTEAGGYLVAGPERPTAKRR